MDETAPFIAELSGPDPSAIRAADVLLRLACDTEAVWTAAKYPDQIDLQIGDGAVKSYRAPRPFSLFRTVLARIATICMHAPTLEWKDVSVDQLPTSFLNLETYLINVNENAPKYYKLEPDTLSNSPYECHSTIVVCAATRPETFLALDVVNHSDRQFLIGKVVNRP